MNKQKKLKEKCEKCGKCIYGKGSYVDAKLVCKKCFYRDRHSNRSPRNPLVFWKEVKMMQETI